MATYKPKGRFYQMTCPDCNKVMSKARIQNHDMSGWFSCWLCECKGDQDYDIVIWSPDVEQLPSNISDED